MTVPSLLTAGYAEVCRAKYRQDRNLRIIFLESVYFVLNGMLVIYAMSAILATTALFAAQRCAKITVVAVATMLIAATWTHLRQTAGQSHTPFLIRNWLTAPGNGSLPFLPDRAAAIIRRRNTTSATEGTGR